MSNKNYNLSLLQILFEEQKEKTKKLSTRLRKVSTLKDKLSDDWYESFKQEAVIEDLIKEISGE